MRAEVASIDRELSERNSGLSAARDHAHDAGQRVAAEHDAVWIAQHLDAIDAGERILRKVDAAADVVGGNAVDEDSVEVRVAAADEGRSHPAALSGLHERHA